VWESVDKVFENYINKTFQIKVDGDKQGKAVLRSVGKLLMNALYGKMLQSAITTDTKICNNLSDVYQFLRTNKLDDYVNFGTKIMMTGETLEEFKQGKINKPRQLGAFVLGYSRRIMLNAMSSIDPTLNTHFFNYTDTDSLHIPIDLLKHCQNILGSSLGKLSNDIKKGGRIVFEKCLAPKTYYYEYINEDGEFLTTMKCKGIPKKLLKPDFYLKEEKFEPVVMKSLKKFRKGEFKIMNNISTRTFGKTVYNKMDLINGKYYPKGYIF
jgi:hypothetical protein